MLCICYKLHINIPINTICIWHMFVGTRPFVPTCEFSCSCPHPSGTKKTTGTIAIPINSSMHLGPNVWQCFTGGFFLFLSLDAWHHDVVQPPRGTCQCSCHGAAGRRKSPPSCPHGCGLRRGAALSGEDGQRDESGDDGERQKWKCCRVVDVYDASLLI